MSAFPYQPELPKLALGGEKKAPSFADECPLSILIADDVYINRRLLSLQLQGLGYKATTTENGRECLKAVLENSYGVLLSDIDMPEMDGIECAICIRQAGFDLPIIAVTASSPEITREKCLEAGMNGYMRKPVNLMELKRALREVFLQKEEATAELMKAVA